MSSEKCDGSQPDAAESDANDSGSSSSFVHVGVDSSPAAPEDIEPLELAQRIKDLAEAMHDCTAAPSVIYTRVEQLHETVYGHATDGDLTEDDFIMVNEGDTEIGTQDKSGMVAYVQNPALKAATNKLEGSLAEAESASEAIPVSLEPKAYESLSDSFDLPPLDTPPHLSDSFELPPLDTPPALEPLPTDHEIEATMKKFYVREEVTAEELTKSPLSTAGAIRPSEIDELPPLRPLFHRRPEKTREEIKALLESQTEYAWLQPVLRTCVRSGPKDVGNVMEVLKPFLSNRPQAHGDKKSVDELADMGEERRKDGPHQQTKPADKPPYTEASTSTGGFTVGSQKKRTSLSPICPNIDASKSGSLQKPDGKKLSFGSSQSGGAGSSGQLASAGSKPGMEAKQRKGKSETSGRSQEKQGKGIDKENY